MANTERCAVTEASELTNHGMAYVRSKRSTRIREESISD
jgi:hypothetical protein